MGFMVKKQMLAQGAAGRRARAIYEQERVNRRHHPATVNPTPPSNEGVVTATAAAVEVTAYGAFPSDGAPVAATVHVPRRGGAAAATAVPVMATAYVPGQAGSAAPAQASAYYDPNAYAAPSASAPAYSQLQSNQQQSFNNGNTHYNTEESSFWECSVCTFPNRRTEPNCKGCASPIPPGMLAAEPQRPPQDTTYGSNLTTQMNNLGMEAGAAGAPAAGGSSGVMRIHIPNGMQPGQKIKVRSPDGKEVLKVIPQQSEWQYDGTGPFFRMQYGSSPPPSNYGGVKPAQDAPPPHVAAWRTFSPACYQPPPLALRAVPHARSGAPVPPNGRLKCLVVGINYTGLRGALAGCINDARNMQTLLRREGYPDDGSHMLLLTDEKNRGNEYQPTKDNITKAIAWLVKDVRRGDVLFFHFSGHGGQEKDPTGHEVDGYNETIIPVDYQRRGQITDDILWGTLCYRLPEGARLTALMDMCHSGTGLDLPFDYNVETWRWAEDVNPAHSAGDVVLLSGCEDSQTSSDVSGGGGQAGGAMTMAFVAAYQRAGAASTYHEFLKAVKDELRRKRFKQRPQLTSSQRFDASSRIFAMGCQGGGNGVPIPIEPNHNPNVGRHKRRNIRPARQGLFGGKRGGEKVLTLAGAAVGAALIADAFF